MELRGQWQNATRSSGSNPSSAEGSTTRGTAISWYLGNRLSNRTDVSRVTEVEDADCTRTIYDLTEETYLVRMRTPVGFERYREVAKRDIDA